MNSFFKYVMSIYVKSLFYSVLLTATTILFSQIIRDIGWLSKAGTFLDLLIYESYTLPMNVINAFAVLVFLSITLTILVLQRNNEIVAFVSLGGSLLRLAVPFVIISILAGIIVFISDNWVIQKTRTLAEEYKYQKFYGKTYSKKDSYKDIWLVDSGAGKIDKDKNIMHIVNYHSLIPTSSLIYNGREFIVDTRDMSIKSVIDFSRVSKIKAGAWQIDNATTYIYKEPKNRTSKIVSESFKNVTDIEKITFNGYQIAQNSISNASSFLSFDVYVHSIKTLYFNTTYYDDFMKLPAVESKYLDFFDLLHALYFLSMRGGDYSTYEHYIYMRISHAFSPLIVSLLIIPICISFSRHNSTFKLATRSLFVGLSYFGFTMLFQTLSERGMLSYFNGFMLPQILFFALAFSLFYFHTRYRS